MTDSQILLVGGCVSALTAWLLTMVLRWSSSSLGLVDVPNARSSHVTPTPRAGGLAFVAAAPVVGMLTFDWSGIPVPPGAGRILIAGLVVAAFSLADDRYGLPVWLRLTVHLFGAIAVVAGGMVLTHVALPGGGIVSTGWLAVPVTVLWIVGLTNVYNFMDGIDGLAGGQAVVTLVTIASLACLLSDRATVLAAVILGASVLGFLVHNWPPATIFMGDVGSAFLGFSFAAWALLPGRSASGLAIPFLVWVAVMAPFLLDTSTAFIWRIAHGEHWNTAHRRHFYQRLVDRGWSHLAVTILYLAVALGLGLACVSAYGWSSR